MIQPSSDGFPNDRPVVHGRETERVASLIPNLPPRLGYRRQRVISVVKIRRVALAAALLAGAITGGAALLQWFWAGWSVYAGPGPTVAARWLLTGAMGAALLLPPGAAMWGAAIGRRCAGPGLRDQVRVTRCGVGRLAALAGAWSLALPLLAALLSAAGWLLVSEMDRASAGTEWGLPSPVTIIGAHGLVMAVAAAFAVWGAATAIGSERRADGSGRQSFSRLPRSVARAAVWGPATLLALVAGPGLVGPALPHLSRPERALDAALLVNPVTAVGAVLGMDVLRSPRVYALTRAPEYWYTYPPAAAVAVVYLALAALGGCHLKRGLERE